MYPLTDKANLNSARISRLVGEALDRAGRLADPVLDSWRRRFDLVDRTTAFDHIHRPARLADCEPARRRLAFDELFRLQLALVLRQERLGRDARGIPHRVVREDGAPTLIDRFVEDLPFAVTGAQRRAIAAIRSDLAGSLPMHRLLQGDVGSGKTVVAVAAMLVAVEGGHQGALMAPTEVLAEQHATEVRSLLEGLVVPDDSTLEGQRPLRTALLTNRTPAGERTRLHDGLADGTVDLLIGTHALLTDQVGFHSLGVVVIDEQHRFGVEQRAALRDKGRGPDGSGRDPDLLVMTATPIPRTAAMVVFGDLDMTIIDELPPGRQPVTTTWLRSPKQAEEAWTRVRDEVATGHRAFVVCPLVEGSDRIPATSVMAEAERLAGNELSGVRLGLLHGQLPSAEKERVMAEFRSGLIDVLVATTVIEVGVDVPEASVMVIEDADRFGIAQLHQLRGRVGQGRRAILVLPVVGQRGSRSRNPTVCDGTDHGRFRAGRGRSRTTRRGNHSRSPPEGAQRSQIGQTHFGPTPGRRRADPGRRAGDRRSRPGRNTDCWSMSCDCSSTRTKPSSCSRAERPAEPVCPGRLPTRGHPRPPVVWTGARDRW